MTAAEFLRVFPLRAPNLMWLLGAGASAASGIPTAGDMIWDFKRRLYCSEQRVSIRACEDISNPALQVKMQRYLDGRGDCPALGSDEEYSYYFSTVFPDEADRRRYIDQMISKAAPSFGFLALAVLMKLSKARLCWTTNYDRNVEDAAARVLGTTGKLIVSALDAPHLMREALQENRGPVLGKLHGDFQSRRLKNTTDELREQDVQLRCELVAECKRNGLIVSGYSGRDHSVMDVLEEAIDDGRGYPSGLFWFSRSRPLQRVTSFVEKAQAVGIEAHILGVQTFDELLADIIAQFPDLPNEDAEFLNNRVKRLTDAPLPQEKGGWPVIRLNAVEIIKFPCVCRLVKCEIGGTSEVFDAIEASGAQLIATRRKVGVLLFGSDREVQKAFGNHNITGTDLYTIEPRRLWYDSVEAGLIYDALAEALARERRLLVERRRGHPVLRIDGTSENSDAYTPLKNTLKETSGLIPGTNVTWAEAIEIHLAYRLGRLWLVIEPMVWTSKPSPAEKDIVREFQRGRQAARYNRQWNDLLSAWCELISGKQPIATISAFGIGDGIDATFEIGDTTGFSRRLIKR